jgi:hypothetical protein
MFASKAGWRPLRRLSGKRRCLAAQSGGRNHTGGRNHSLRAKRGLIGPGDYLPLSVPLYAASANNVPENFKKDRPTAKND